MSYNVVGTADVIPLIDHVSQPDNLPARISYPPYFRGVDIMKSYKQGNSARSRTGTPINRNLTGGIPESLNSIELSIVGTLHMKVRQFLSDILKHRGLGNVQ
jgi:hypothetical protein